MIAAILLAAGLSRRMGQAKLLLDLGGQPVIRRSAECVLAGGVDELTVVTGVEHGALGSALAGLPVRLVVNPSPEAGQGSSISVGIGALSAGTRAALIALGDQPWLPREVIPALLAALARTGTAIVAPRYREGRGNPVLFSRAVFPELLELSGDRGARSVIERDPGRVLLVDLDLATPADLDTRADYDRLRSQGEPV